jgi:hypothetical protein
MELIHQQYGVNFVYDSSLDLDQIAGRAGNDVLKETDNDVISSRHSRLDRESLEACLAALFKDTGIEYEIMKKYIVLTKAGSKKKPKDYTIFIEEQHDTIDESRITAFVGRQKNATQTGLTRLDGKKFQRGFYFMSSPDLVKTLQMLPGVSGGSELFSGLHVYGGDGYDNLYLMDGIPMYQAGHLAGLFSAFNTDVIETVDFYKSGFPARYGGRLSSVVDVRTKEGDFNQYHGSFSIGLVDSRFQLEGPIVKGKTSFNISARRTYSDLITNAALWYMTHIQDDETNYGAGYYFYDLNVKVNHKFSDRDRLYLSHYSGDDEIYFSINEADTKDYRSDSKLGWKWGNIVTAARWNHVIHPQMFLDASVSYTQYRHKIGMGFDEKDKILDQSYKAQLDMHSGIYDLTGKAELHYSPNPHHDMRMGMAYTYHTFSPDVMTMSEKQNKEENTQQIGEPDILAHETQLYAEDNMTLGNAVKVNAGLNYSTFTVGSKFYHALEPRLSSRLLLTDDLSLKAGYAYMTQYVHLLSNSSISLPTDLWVPVTESILPEHSHQVAAGAYYEIDGWCDLSAEAYYKRLNNLLEYREGTSFMTGTT